MSEERGKTMTNVNRIVAENNKVVRYINGNSIAETYAKQEAHSAGVYISLTGNPEAICVARFNYGMKETSSVAITMQAAKLMAEIIFLFSAGGSSAVPEELSHKQAIFLKVTGNTFDEAEKMAHEWLMNFSDKHKLHSVK